MTFDYPLEEILELSTSDYLNDCVFIFCQLKMEAESIFHNHLDVNAPMPVNIDSSAVKDAEEHLHNPNNDMYRLQQQQVK